MGYGYKMLINAQRRTDPNQDTPVPMKVFYRFIGALLLLLYAASLCLPVGQIGESTGYWEMGYEVLRDGWLAILTQRQIGWLGNFGIVVPIYLLLRLRPVPVSFMLLNTVCFVSSWHWVAIEGENRDKIFAYGIGYYLWLTCLASCGLMALFGAAKRHLER